MREHTHTSSPAFHGQPGQAERLARALTRQALAYFAEHEVHALDMVRTQLMELVDARPSFGQGQNLRSAHLLLGRYGESFNRALQTELEQAIGEELAGILHLHVRATQAASVDDAMHGVSLSLIDVHEVERVLRLDRVAQRFSARYESTLEPLTQRLSVLFGRETSSIHDNPFQPVVLLRAFLAAWDRCAWDSQATPDLLESLNPASWFNLAPLYVALNGSLLQAGVPARGGLRIRNHVGGSTPVQAARSAPSTPVPSSPGGSVPGGVTPVRRSAAGTARQFLQRLGLNLGNEGAQRPAFRSSSPALMGFLGNLQADASAAASQRWPQLPDSPSANVLRDMRESEEVRRAPELDRGTVDALAEVFDFVFADHAIPAQMKAVIGRLQVPVLKAAMIDRDFFLTDQHPARRLIDTLAGASLAWEPQHGEGDPLYLRIEHTVQRVLNEFEDDLSLFGDLLHDFAEFLFESEQQAQARVEPVARQELTGESWSHALSLADEHIHERVAALTGERAVASFMVPFLTNQWREVMARAWMDERTRAHGYQLAVTTMEQLIWSIEPKTSSEERRQLVAILPDMVRQLNVGLDTIDWNGKPRATFTRRLITTHTLAIRMTQAMPLDTGSAALDQRDGQLALRQLNERRAACQFDAVDPFDVQAQSFQRGLWFDAVVDDQTLVRCRLSWVSPMRTRFVFTNREGFDAFVRSEREVAAMLRRRRLRLLDQDAIVGRAIDRIMASDDAAVAA